MFNCCSDCNSHDKPLIKTSYGDLLCEDCWDDYLCTARGRVEYIIGLAQEKYSLADFDADFLGFAIKQWYKNKELLALSYNEIVAIEFNLKCLGLIE